MSLKRNIKLDFSIYCTTLIYGLPGSGKTYLIKYIVNALNYDKSYKIYIVTESNDILDGLKYHKKRIIVTDEFNFDRIDKFRNLRGKKILIFDDILDLALGDRQKARKVSELLSRSRKYDMFVFVGTQMLYQIGKPFRMMARNFITFQHDYDADTHLHNISTVPKKDISKRELNQYEFLYFVQGTRSILKGRI